MKYSLYFIFLLLAACSTAPKVKEIQTTAAKPKWISTPSAACSSFEICVLGSGTGMNMAQMNARNEIAKIFETNIHSLTTTRGDISSVNLDETITESTEAVLSNIEIRNTFEDEKGFYVLAVLNKSAAAETAREEMERLDTQMALLLKAETLPAAIQLQDMYNKRSALNQRYSVLAGVRIPEKISYKEMAEYKAKMFKHKKIALKSEKNQNGLFFAVQDVLSKSGYVITESSGKGIPEVFVSVKAEPQHINVKGFVKYTFHFQLSSRLPGEDPTETVSASFAETGRSYVQAYESAVLRFKTYLTTHIPVF